MPTQPAPHSVPEPRPIDRPSAAICTPGLSLVPTVLGLAALVALHAALAGVWPLLTGGRLGFGLNLGWLVADVFLVAVVVLRQPPPIVRTAAAVALGYTAILWLLWPLIQVLDENLLLLILALMIYGGLLRHPFYLGYLFLFLLAQRFLPAYLYPSFFLTALLYTTLPPFLRAWRDQRQWFIPLCHVAGLTLLTGLLLPVAFYCLQGSPQNLHRELRDPEVMAALLTSFRTSMFATLVVLILGVPLAYALVRVPFPGRALIDTLIDLPIVVPPPIAGITLLAFTGPRSPLGSWLEARWGVTLFDSAAAIVLAQAFVSSPFLIRAAMIAFGAVDVRYENVARTLGSRPISAFFRITLPLALPGILIGTMLTWFRAIAEFGSLRVVANRPRTMPILAYERFLGYGQLEAHSIGVLVLLMCLAVIAGMWIIRAIPLVVRRSVGAIDAAR
jgi:molybdate/tungstate transport system permease protein